MQASDSSLGPYLRSEREQQGIGLQDIASLTKIQPKFIEALEADDYDRLPKGPFAVGFIRSYAQCLSLDPDEVVAFFQTRYKTPPPSQPVQEEPLPQPPASSQHSALPLTRRGMVLSVGLIVFVGLLFWVLWSLPWGQQQAAQDRAVETAAEPSATPNAALTPISQEPAAPKPDTPSELSAPSNPGAQPIATDTPPADAPPLDTTAQAVSQSVRLEPAPLVLRVQALEKTWMRLNIDDETQQEALIEAGQSVEWKAKAQFSLTIGNVRGARVLLNDQELDLPATRSNVLRDYVLTRALLNPRHTD